MNFSIDLKKKSLSNQLLMVFPHSVKKIQLWRTVLTFNLFRDLNKNSKKYLFKKYHIL